MEMFFLHGRNKYERVAFLSLHVTVVAPPPKISLHLHVRGFIAKNCLNGTWCTRQTGRETRATREDADGKRDCELWTNITDLHHPQEGKDEEKDCCE